jgi:hypothetical protein
MTGRVAEIQYTLGLKCLVALLRWLQCGSIYRQPAADYLTLYLALSSVKTFS